MPRLAGPSWPASASRRPWLCGGHCVSCAVAVWYTGGKKSHLSDAPKRPHRQEQGLLPKRWTNISGFGDYDDMVVVVRGPNRTHIVEGAGASGPGDRKAAEAVRPAFLQSRPARAAQPGPPVLAGPSQIRYDPGPAAGMSLLLDVPCWAASNRCSAGVADSVPSSSMRPGARPRCGRRAGQSGDRAYSASSPPSAVRRRPSDSAESYRSPGKAFCRSSPAPRPTCSPEPRISSAATARWHRCWSAGEGAREFYPTRKRASTPWRSCSTQARGNTPACPSA